MRLQYGRAPALLRGPIWQSSWREAALTWASLAQTCLATSLPAQEGAGCARLGQATGAFLTSATLMPCLCTSAPGGLGEGLGPVAGTVPRVPAGRTPSEEREGQVQGSSTGCLAAQTQRHTESTRLPGPLAGVCSPAHPEADSVGAQQLRHTRSFPSTLVPSRDVCSWLGPAPACVASLPHPSSGEAAETCRRR